MKRFLTPIIFWVLIGVFLVVVSQFFVPVVSDLLRGPLLFLLPIFVFSLLGGALIFSTVKEKLEGALKKFLLLTGASAAGFFVFVCLHNVFYALGIMVARITILSYLMEVFHIVFFMVATLICPVGFLIGVVGSSVLLIKKKKKSMTPPSEKESPF